MSEQDQIDPVDAQAPGAQAAQGAQAIDTQALAAALLAAIQAASAEGKLATPAPQQTTSSKGAAWKVMLAVALLLFGITFGIGSGVLLPASAKANLEDSTIDPQALTNPLTESNLREAFQQEVERQMTKAMGEGGQYQDLLKRIREAVTASEESIKTANEAYARGMADIERARQASLAKGAGTAEEIQQQVRDTLKSIGINVPKQDISCLTDPSWSPDEAARKLAAESLAAKSRQASVPSDVAVPPPTSPVDTGALVRSAIDKTAAALNSDPKAAEQVMEAIRKIQASEQAQPASRAGAASAPSGSS